MIKILANDGLDEKAVDTLKGAGFIVDTSHYKEAELEKQIQEVDCIIIRSATKIRKPLIDIANQTKKLKLIIRAGVGIDNIDHQYAKEEGIDVKNTPNASSDAVAELALGHMFVLARHIHSSNPTMRNGEWNKKQYKGIEINGKKLGLIGFGRIAKSLAKKANALGMTVVYTDLLEHEEVDYAKATDKENLLKTCDFVSLHIPFIKEYGPIISTKEFKIMKKGMYLINCARGGVVDEAALLVALNNNTVAKAACDVFEDEPTKNTALCTHPNISLTPHIGASTTEAQARIGLEVIDTVKKYFA